MFIKRTKDILSLDEQQLRERVTQLRQNTLSERKMLKMAVFACMGTWAVTSCIGLVLPVFLGLSLPFAMGATLAVPLGSLGYYFEWRAEQKRLNDAADKMRDMKSLAQQAAERLGEKGLVLEAPTVVRAPLRLQLNKSPSPRF